MSWWSNLNRLRLGLQFAQSSQQSPPPTHPNTVSELSTWTRNWWRWLWIQWSQAQPKGSTSNRCPSTHHCPRLQVDKLSSHRCETGGLLPAWRRITSNLWCSVPAHKSSLYHFSYVNKAPLNGKRANPAASGDLTTTPDWSKVLYKTLVMQWNFADFLVRDLCSCRWSQTWEEGVWFLCCLHLTGFHLPSVRTQVNYLLGAKWETQHMATGKS